MSQLKETHLLLVEDDLVLAEYLRRFFESHRFRVSLAPDMYSAHQFLQSKKIEVLLLDVLLPDVNGLEFLNFLRHQLMLKGPNVYLMSVLTQPQIKELGFRFGARDFFIKPFHPENVLNKIQQDLLLV